MIHPSFIIVSIDRSIEGRTKEPLGLNDRQYHLQPVSKYMSDPFQSFIQSPSLFDSETTDNPNERKHRSLIRKLPDDLVLNDVVL